MKFIHFCGGPSSRGALFSGGIPPETLSSNSGVPNGTKVAVICVAPLRDQGTIGGTYAKVLGESLASDGLHVELWTSSTGLAPAPADVSIVQVWRPGFRAWLDIVRAVLRRRPDVVHFQHYLLMFGSGPAGELSTLALMICLSILRVRVVSTLHDLPGLAQITPAYIKMHNYHYPAWLIRAALRVSFKLIGAVSRNIIVHHEIFATRAAEFSIPIAKIRVISHMPLPAEQIQRVVARRELGLSEGDQLVLFFGYATGYKGIEDLLEAFAILRARRRPIHLLLGASLPPKAQDDEAHRRYYSALESRAAELENVRFLGFIDERKLSAYICAADVGILPYRAYHGASGPMFSYLAHDCPVLVSQPIAAHTAELVTAVFETTSQDIARAVSQFFDDDYVRDEVRTQCDRLRQASLANEYVALTRAVYGEAIH